MRAPEVEVNIASIVDGLSPHERRNFSFRKIIAYKADSEHGEPPGLEYEVSSAIAKQLKRTTGGFFCPTALTSVSEPKSRTGLDTKSGAAGGYTVATALVPDLIELQRGKSLAIKLGAQVLTGLTGALTFAVKTSGTSANWVGENTGTNVDQADPAFGQRALVPKTAQATTAYRRKLLVQSSLGIEASIRSELAQAHAEAIDIAAIQGPGTAFRPLGILNCPGIGSVAGGTNGAIPSFGNVIGLESAIATNNADVGALAYVSTAGIRGVLKQTPKAANTAEMVWGMMPGLPGVGEAMVTRPMRPATCPRRSRRVRAAAFVTPSSLGTGAKW
jgi:HK97 family phage major capsid protein